jgi:hypothetical protein
MRYVVIVMLLALATSMFCLAFTRKPIVYRFAKNPTEVASAAKVARTERFLLGVLSLCIAIISMLKK